MGLTSALLLSRDPKNKVTIVARHMPGDYDIEYTSPWAGANVLPYVAPDAPEEQEEEGKTEKKKRKKTKKNKKKQKKSA